MKEEDAKEYINAIKTKGFIYNSVTVGIILIPEQMKKAI